MCHTHVAPTGTALNCLMLSVPYSHIKGLASDKAKMLLWREIFWAMGEPHNHKPILPDTLLCLCLSSHRRAWITSTVAPLSSSKHAPSHVKDSAVSGGSSKQKGSLDHVASACPVSSGASGVIRPAALRLVVGFTVVQGSGTVGFCAIISLENLRILGDQRGWKSYFVHPII